MKHLLIYAHPNPESFNHALMESAREELSLEGEVEVRDLYALGFDPCLGAGDFAAFREGRVPEDIAREQEWVRWADHLVFFYPVWWYDRPAILKGWVDRVFSTHFAYRDDPESGTTLGLLGPREATVVCTLGVTAEDLDAIHPHAREWKFAAMNQGTLEYCGIRVRDFLPLFGVSQVDHAARVEMIEELRSRLRRAG